MTAVNVIVVKQDEKNKSPIILSCFKITVRKKDASSSKKIEMKLGKQEVQKETELFWRGTEIH